VLSVREFLEEKCIIDILPQAPYSPDLSSGDFDLFPKLESRVKGYHFHALDSVQKGVTDAIKTLRETDFQTCHVAWKILWPKYVTSEGCYFERDNVDLDE
jgi:hypothetical protein